jgi:hypothetical protein
MKHTNGYQNKNNKFTYLPKISSEILSKISIDLTKVNTTHKVLDKIENFKYKFGDVKVKPLINFDGVMKDGFSDKLLN